MLCWCGLPVGGGSVTCSLDVVGRVGRAKALRLGASGNNACGCCSPLEAPPWHSLYPPTLSVKTFIRLGGSGASRLIHLGGVVDECGDPSGVTACLLCFLSTVCPRRLGTWLCVLAFLACFVVYFFISFEDLLNTLYRLAVWLY